MPENKADERVLIVAPFGQDAAAMANLLTEGGFGAEVCHAATDACGWMSTCVGALLLTEEALELPHISALLEHLKIQPPWSEVPVIILTRPGESHRVKLMDLIANAANSMTLLERPIRFATLCRSVEVALGSRRRQYQMRDLLQEEQRKQRELLQIQDGLEKAQSELKQQGATLENTVAERTRDLRTANDRLERSNHDLEQFAYAASHDLQEPLRAVTGCGQILRKRYGGKLDSSADELIEHIVEGASRMEKLILDLLAFSRVATQQKELAEVDSGGALKQALANIETAINENGAAITLGRLPVVSFNPVQLTQLFQNLLCNALKYRSSLAPVIHVEAVRRADDWQFCVRDNGIGIEAKYFDRIFVLFQRLHTRNEYPGTGIGLALCKKIVERHGGRIWVESALGQGSAFFFTTPFQR